MGRVKEKKNVVFVSGKKEGKDGNSRIVLELLRKGYRKASAETPCKKEPEDGYGGKH